PSGSTSTSLPPPPPPPPPGNQQPLIPFVPVDHTPPNTLITAGPSGPTNSGAAQLTFDSTEANSTFECSFDGSGISVCSSPDEQTGLSDGQHTFQVQATDAAGNTDPTPATRTFTVDTQAPPKPELVSGPNDPSNASTAHFEFEIGRASCRERV